MPKRKQPLSFGSRPIWVNPHRDLVKVNGRWVDREYFGSEDRYTDFRLSYQRPTVHPRVQTIAELVRDDADYVAQRTSRPDANLRLDARLDLPKKRASLAPAVSPVSPVSPPAAVEAPAITDEDKSWITQELRQTTSELKADMDKFDTDTYYRAGGIPTIQVVSAFHDEKDKINTYLDKILSTLAQLVDRFQQVEKRISKLERYVAKVEKYLNALNSVFDISCLLRTFNVLKIQIIDIQQMAREERKKDFDSAYANRAANPTPSNATVGDLVKAAMDQPATPKMSRRTMFNDGLPTPPATPTAARKTFANPDDLPAAPAAKTSDCGPQ